MDIMRISDPSEADFQRLARYRQAIKILDGEAQEVTQCEMQLYFLGMLSYSMLTEYLYL
jgi:hypothetical protein